MTSPLHSWKLKAAVMQTCAALPKGDLLYRFIQAKFGRLSPDPFPRLQAQCRMARTLLDHGFSIAGATLFEVGTGHKPVAPVGFFLCGAERVITVDLHRRLDFKILRAALARIVDRSSELESLYEGITDIPLFRRRLALLKQWKDLPEQFLQKAGIRYLAPRDAAQTGLEEGSVNGHFSVTVLEHIPPDVLSQIFREAKRILRPDGFALHFVDLTDHFQHQDPSISSINFLRYSEDQWRRIAGNEFAYCNRLRASHYRRLFEELGFTIRLFETDMDDSAFQRLQSGFDVDSAFRECRDEDLCISEVRALLTL